MKNTNLIIIGIVALLIGGGIGFFGGMTYQKSQTQSSMPGNFQGGQFQGRQGGNRTFGNGTGIRPVSGEILSTDSGSITVKLQDGSSKIILITDKTTIGKSASASASDLKQGEQVAAFGSENEGGSITATNIQIGGGAFRVRTSQ